uniref:Uncharacterized protein n=1 Tax=Parascaris univalens TaxID=6257 RepID=A0A914ZL72_PARUN
VRNREYRSALSASSPVASSLVEMRFYSRSHSFCTLNEAPRKDILWVWEVHRGKSIFVFSIAAVLLITFPSVSLLHISSSMSTQLRVTFCCWHLRVRGYKFSRNWLFIRSTFQLLW